MVSGTKVLALAVWALVSVWTVHAQTGPSRDDVRLLRGEGGHGPGSGGDPVAVEFQQVGLAWADELDRHPSIEPELDRVRFRGVIRELPVEMVSHSSDLEVANCVASYRTDLPLGPCLTESPRRILVHPLVWMILRLDARSSTDLLDKIVLSVYWRALGAPVPTARQVDRVVESIGHLERRPRVSSTARSESARLTGLAASSSPRRDFAELAATIADSLVRFRSFPGRGPRSQRDRAAFEFQDEGVEILALLRAYPEVEPGIARAAFERALQNARLESTLEELNCRSTFTGADPDRPLLRAGACNWPELDLIRISRTDWRRAQGSSQTWIRWVWVLHEYMGLMGIDDPSYERSRAAVARLLANLSITDQATRAAGPTPHAVATSHFLYGEQATGYVGRIGLGIGMTLTPPDGVRPIGLMDGQFTAFLGSEIWNGALDLRAAFGSDGSRAVFRVHASASGAVLGLVGGVWAALDVTDDSVLASRFAAFGTGMVIPLQVDRRTFLLIRLNAGGSVGGITDRSAEDTTVRLAGELQVVLRYSQFFVEVNASSRGVGLPSGRAAALTEAEVALGYVMNLIFPGDAVRIAGRHLRLDPSDGSAPLIEATTLSAFFEARL